MNIPDPRLVPEPECFDSVKRKIVKSLRDSIKKSEKKIGHLLESLEEGSQWEHLLHCGELLKANFGSIRKGLHAIEVTDWKSGEPAEIRLDPKKTPPEQLEVYFKAARKRKRSIEPLGRQLEIVRSRLEGLKTRIESIERCKTREELDSLSEGFIVNRPAVGSSSPGPGRKAVSPVYREYLSARGLKIRVGKTGKANDILTFKLARGRDYWLHVDGYPGSHVVIFLEENDEPDEETLKDAECLALHYSQAKKFGEGEIVRTRCKHVKRPKNGSAGQATLSECKKSRIRFDPERYNRLKERSS